MTNEQLRLLFNDADVAKRARAILQRMARTERARRLRALNRGEESYEVACRKYNVSYAVLRSIKCNKGMRGATGFINKKELATYMVGYKHKPRKSNK